MSAVVKEQIKPFHETDRFTLFCGDCRSVLPIFDDCSVDSIVCDPPYELGFMGKGWDRSGIAYDVEVWLECLRVLKPGAHLLAFGGSRTYHRLACAIEDAGFEIRDQIQWLYGSGFPKSLDVSKAIDAARGVERSGTGEIVRAGCRAARDGGELVGSKTIEGAKWKELTVPATDEAKQWSGWGTALKPAHEPIVLARKPLIGTVAENVLQHGTGGLNIDGCRIETGDDLNGGAYSGDERRRLNYSSTDTDASAPLTRLKRGIGEYAQPIGRWPSNLIHDGSDEVVSLFPETASGASDGNRNADLQRTVFSGLHGNESRRGWEANQGSAARFFYCAKATQEDRNEGLESSTPSRSLFAEGTGLRNNGDGTPRNQTPTSRNHHPTVKPTDLMRYLCRLITPPGGMVLDPFCGSGSTGKAAMLERFRFIGIELSTEYCELAQRRIDAVTKQGLLFQ